MPIFVFSPHDVDAIIDYLQSIQEKPGGTDETPETAPGETPEE